MMAKVTIVDLARRRQYSELEKQADELIRREGWNQLLQQLKLVRPDGKARDAVIALLQLESVGGTDSDVFTEFSSLEGESLRQVRANAVSVVTDVLKDQIENRHTYFLDIEAMTMTPYVILVKDVIDGRKRELEKLEGNSSRIEVLGTYYGFQILLTDGSRPHDDQVSTGYHRWRRRTWLDERITESAADALKSLTGELAQEVDMDKRYRTLGSDPVFRNRCTTATANILADAVRLALYKTPGHRGSAARRLGKTEDSRVVPFLHHRLPLEQSWKARISITDAIGRVGHESSIDVLKERAVPRNRYMTKEGLAVIEALGGIYSPQCKETLIGLMRNGGNTIRAAAIQALSKQEPTRLIDQISPYLVDKSRPVVRASVLALSELGREGTDAIREKAPLVIKRIGYDRPSRPALIKMLSISEVAGMSSVQQYFAKRIEKLAKQVRTWQQRPYSNYGYYWRRRETRSKQLLEDYLRLASTHLEPPIDKDLVRVIKTVVRPNSEENSTIRVLGDKLLARNVEKKIDVLSFIQAHLPPF
jgi:HEAT repeat protein